MRISSVLRGVGVLILEARNTPSFLVLVAWASSLLGACGKEGAPKSDGRITRLDDTSIDTTALTEGIEALTRAANVQAVLRREGLRETSWNEIFRPQIRIRTRMQFEPGSEETTSANDAIELSYGLGWGLQRTPSSASVPSADARQLARFIDRFDPPVRRRIIQSVSARRRPRTARRHAE